MDKQEARIELARLLQSLPINGEDFTLESYFDEVDVLMPFVERFAREFAADELDTVCGQSKPDHGALREELAQFLIRTFFWGLAHGREQEAADALLSGPLAPVLAERDELRATIARVEALADDLDAAAWHGERATALRIRDALHPDTDS